MPRKIERPFQAPILFSICTLVTNEAQYRDMYKSFCRGGFDGADVEFLYIDNSKGNLFEAYDGLNCLISHARGRYFILCHQDVFLIKDDRETLLTRLRELETLDPNWALAGNAGGVDHQRAAHKITSRDGIEYDSKELPKRVITLDENFIVMKSSSRLGFSRDLSSFHFYGTDICLQAECRGWSAYVIDFHLRHVGIGTINEEFRETHQDLEEKYAAFFTPRTLRTTCTTVFPEPSPTKRALKKHVRTIRWHRRAIWKWLRGKPLPPKT